MVQSVQKCFMAWAKDKDILRQSSSGGIFSVLANNVLSKKGVVFGAAITDYNTKTLEHVCITSSEELQSLRKSKYYQSSIGNTYLMTKEALDSDQLVMFSGTACQIAGLMSFLNATKTETKKLITVDVLCHGVPSRKVVNAYIKSQQKRYRKRIIDNTFRTKDVTWNGGGGTSMTLWFEDYTKIILRAEEDPYFVGFNQNLFLRPSCYACAFAGVNRQADFTLADFWGVDTIKEVPYEILQDGVSLVLINTEKGLQMWNGIKEKVYFEEAPLEKAKKYNLALIKPQKKHKRRDVFFKYLSKVDFNTLVKVCCIDTYCKNTAWQLLGKDRMMKIKQLFGR